MTLDYSMLILDAVSRLRPGVALADLGDDVEQVSIRSWSQLFASTAGPFGGIGGAAITSVRIVMVQLGQYAVCYAGTRYLYTLDLALPAAYEYWANSHAPLLTEAAELLAPEPVAH